MPSHKLSRFSAWCVFLVHQVLIAIYYSTSIFNPAHSGTANEWAIQISSGNFIGKLPLVPIGETGSIFHASPVAHGMAACFECCHSHRRPRLVTTVVCQHMDNVLDIYWSCANSFRPTLLSRAWLKTNFLDKVYWLLAKMQITYIVAAVVNAFIFILYHWMKSIFAGQFLHSIYVHRRTIFNVVTILHWNDVWSVLGQRQRWKQIMLRIFKFYFTTIFFSFFSVGEWSNCNWAFHGLLTWVAEWSACWKL